MLNEFAARSVDLFRLSLAVPLDEPGANAQAIAPEYFVASIVATDGQVQHSLTPSKPPEQVGQTKRLPCWNTKDVP